MEYEITVPEVSNDSKVGIIVRWYKNDGDLVEKNEEIAEVMIEKITLRIRAPETGRLKIIKKENEEVRERELIGKVFK